jgi:c-di-GMP-binding flagellar brake protein YcgR
MTTATATSTSSRDDLLTRYGVRSRREIAALLRQIQQRKLLVNLDLPNSRQIVVTAVLAVDESRDTLILDSARGDTLNRELLSGPGAEFVTQLDGVTVSFFTGPVAFCEHEKLPALRIPLPKALVRLQRREHFRVAMPIAHPVKCLVPQQDEGETEPVTTHVVDLSCGGVALADIAGRISPEPGRRLPACRILLPDAPPVVTTLEIRNSAQIRLHSGAFQMRLGCQFIGLPKDMAAPLQRFVMEIERARRANL